VSPRDALPQALRTKARVETMEKYRSLYERSVRDPKGFWGELADHLDWYKRWEKALEYDFSKPGGNWFKGGKLNVSDNCIDRHLHTGRTDKAALIWQGEPAEENKCLTYPQLHEHVCKFANVLKKLGVGKGDRVCLYLPMIPELPIAMFACARIGAIHTVVFAGLGAKGLRDRINHSGSKVLITADGYYREDKIVRSKITADEALRECPGVERVIVVKRLGIDTPFSKERDLWWHEEIARGGINPNCEPAAMDAEDPLFLLYASGPSDHPAGIVHSTGGYVLFVSQMLKWAFHVNEEDVLFCAEDASSATGHSHVVYGPLALGVTTVIFEGSSTYPNPDRLWEIVEKYKVSIFCTGSAAIRALMQEGDACVQRRKISSLRILGTVGEPIDPEAWGGCRAQIGLERCPVIDTWSQAETGGLLFSPLPAPPFKQGSAKLPFPGIVPKILREDGSECEVDEVGFLVIANPWPAMPRGLWNDSDQRRFKETYFKPFPRYYATGEAAKRDADGYFHPMGRIDHVIDVSGNRIGMAEVERALTSHPSVAEAALVGIPHSKKGKKLYGFVILKTGIQESKGLREEILTHVKKAIGSDAAPDELQFAEVLPDSGKSEVLRRLLRKIGEEKIEALGGTSTDSITSGECRNIESSPPILPWEKEGSNVQILAGELFPPHTKGPLFYHPGHTWVKVEKADEVRIGIDYFLGKIIGKAKVIVLPLPGRSCIQGENLCSIIQEHGILNIVFPVSGSVLSVNQRLKDEPELVTKDPLEEGFLLTLRPKNLQRDQRHLFSGQAALPWYQKELERFKTAVVSELYGRERVGMTMQDGRIGLGNIRCSAGPERYIQLVSTFLRKGEKDSSRPSH
jgi:acetyl-CoA synthetase